MPISINAPGSISREGGHPAIPEIETIFKEGGKPFSQSLIAFGETWKYLKKRGSKKT